MKTVRLVFMAIFWLTLGEAALAALIVIRAEGPSASSYPAGRILDSGQPLSLRKGDRLTLLDGAGTRVVAGPMVGKLSASTSVDARGSIDELRRIFSRSRERRSVLGASRGFAMPPDAPQILPPSLWTINVHKAGPWCIAPGIPVSLVRDDAYVPAYLEMRGAEPNSRLDFPKGAREVSFSYPMKNESRFTYFSSNRPMGELTIRPIQPPQSGIVELAQQFLENGCYEQIDLIQSVTG